jgi:hypothetical protein
MWLGRFFKARLTLLSFRRSTSAKPQPFSHKYREIINNNARPRHIIDPSLQHLTQLTNPHLPTFTSASTAQSAHTSRVQPDASGDSLISNNFQRHSIKLTSVRELLTTLPQLRHQHL